MTFLGLRGRNRAGDVVAETQVDDCQGLAAVMRRWDDLRLIPEVAELRPAGGAIFASLNGQPADDKTETMDADAVYGIHAIGHDGTIVVQLPVLSCYEIAVNMEKWSKTSVRPIIGILTGAARETSLDVRGSFSDGCITCTGRGWLRVSIPYSDPNRPRPGSCPTCPDCATWPRDMNRVRDQERAALHQAATAS